MGCVRATVLGFLAAFVVASPAAAASLHVTNAGDGAPPAATLRNQIASAAPGDTVVVDAGVNPTLSDGEIAIDKDLTIRGQGDDVTSIGSAGSSRIFNIGAIEPGAVVVIRDLKITNAASAPGANGGAILNAATLTIDRSTLSENATSDGVDGTPGSGNGGAIANSGPLTIVDSTFTDNRTGDGFSGPATTEVGADVRNGGSAGWGGAIAIANPGTSSISGSTFSANATGDGGNGTSFTGFFPAVAGDGGEGGYGGAIFVSSFSNSVVNSTFYANSAGAGGGGGTNANFPSGRGDDGHDGSAGAIIVAGTTGGMQVDIMHATMVANTVTGTQSNVSHVASIVADLGMGAFVKHSILSSTLSNCSGSVFDQGGNIARKGGGADSSCSGFGNVDPKLDPAGLADNGGQTQTIALLPDSPLKDLLTADCPATDQRGFARPANACDSGAFEVQSPTDTDGDGVENAVDACPAGAGVGMDTDGDGCKNVEDADDDNDGVADGADSCPVGTAAGTDTDGDGCKDDVEDADDDGDTVPDEVDQCPSQSGVAPSGCPSAGAGGGETGFGTGAGSGTGTGTATTPAFGADTRVTLRVKTRRIRARDALQVLVSNGNAFAVTATVGAQTGKLAPRRKTVSLGHKTSTVAAAATATLSFRLPAAARRALVSKGKLAVTITAAVKDPTGSTRTVRIRTTLQLRR